MTKRGDEDGVGPERPALDDEALAESLAMEEGFGGIGAAEPLDPAPPEAASRETTAPETALQRSGRHRRAGAAADATDATVGSDSAGGTPDAQASTDDAAASSAVGGWWRRRRTRRKRKAPWWELPLLVALAIVIAILVKTFLVQPFYIPSASMEKTLHGCPGCGGDRILVNKPIYDLRDPHPGDIVVFHAPKGWDEEPPSTPPSNPVLRTLRGFGQLIGFVPPDGLVLVKRVIAIGGQTVKGDAAGHVLVSDHGTAGPWRTLNEPYVFEDGPDSHAAFGPVTVPKGRLWVMGDHRNDSADSRYHCGPDGVQGPDGSDCHAISSTVPISAVIGKAVLIVWPPSRWRTLGTPSTFKQAALAAGDAVPVGTASVIVLPLYLFRRRRRRRR